MPNTFVKQARLYLGFQKNRLWNTLAGFGLSCLAFGACHWVFTEANFVKLYIAPPTGK